MESCETTRLHSNVLTKAGTRATQPLVHYEWMLHIVVIDIAMGKRKKYLELERLSVTYRIIYIIRDKFLPLRFDYYLLLLVLGGDP